MFIFIIGRHNDTHIVDYKNVQGKYRTLCGKNYYQNKSITTLGSDNTFNGICPICKKYHDEMYLSDLDNYVRLARSSTYKCFDFMEFVKYDLIGPKADYEMAWERVWNKLNRARSITKNKSYKYYGK